MGISPAGTSAWTFYGPTDYWVVNGVLQFKHMDNSAPGGFFQTTPYALADRRAGRGHGRSG